MLRSLPLRGALLPLLTASALLLSAATAQATSTVASHADPSGSSSDPVFSLIFGGVAGIVNGVNMWSDALLSGSYTELASNPAPDAPLQLINGVTFSDWDFVFPQITYAVQWTVNGFRFYAGVQSGSFAYYLANSDHTNPANLILSATFVTSTLTIPASGVGSIDFGGGVDLTYGAASGLSGYGLADPEQFGFSFANYAGGTGAVAEGIFTATATASMTSSATVEVPEPIGAALVGAGLLALAVLRTRS